MQNTGSGHGAGGPAPDGRRWFGPRLEWLGACHAATVPVQVETYNSYQPAADWNVNLIEGTLRQGAVTVRVSPLGSLGTDASWLWAWANEQTFPPDSPGAVASRRLREIGERIGAPELTTPRLELAEFADPRLAAERLMMAAMGALYGRGYAGVTAGTGARVYLLVDDPAVPLAEFDRVAMPRHLVRGVELFPHDHFETAWGYLTRYGFTITRKDRDELVGERPGCSVRIVFDQHGRITKVSANLGG
ncbi:DUF6882 domain-containing protein [Allonocardiopsis opalescens]|uniref:Uncharacterized protein n=1 Tax=Allonocardiopsis opalescens TaxID=1144618 RepID=A0A2T0QAX7_9ACTN|nr:DUF6882 domain-containing protein [Allonocardiopsis opalescens]PRY00970.1 hypothetical protein CLV72_102603 [Allonocardiopsis opalescens]